MTGGNILPMMSTPVTSHQPTHQAMDVTVIKTEAPSAPNKYMLENGGAQLFGENTDLALDPALSEINIQVGAGRGRDDEFNYMFGPQAFVQSMR